MRIRQNFTIAFIISILFSCSEKIHVETPKSTEMVKTEVLPNKPLNIILLIGDGMGLSQISTRYYYPDGPINFDRFNHIGLINTSSASDLITDSAAGATAFSAGVSTYNAAIAVDMDTVPVPTILEQLTDIGYKAGIVSTSSITHATPASFYAHSNHRYNYEDIASQLVDSKVDFFAGAGQQYFNNRSDSADLYLDLKTKGFELYTGNHLPMIKRIDKAKRYAFLNAEKSMPKMQEGRGDYLPLATKMALDYLGQRENGFFLMVEGSQIDWGGHANDSEYIIKETADFDKVIGIALDYAERNANTLVIVTADHETGGYALSGKVNEETGKADYNSIDPKFTSGGHTATLIPVFAYGPNSESFNGIYKNTGIYDRMMEACQANGVMLK